MDPPNIRKCNIYIWSLYIWFFVRKKLLTRDCIFLIILFRVISSFAVRKLKLLKSISPLKYCELRDPKSRNTSCFYFLDHILQSEFLHFVKPYLTARSPASLLLSFWSLLSSSILRSKEINLTLLSFLQQNRFQHSLFSRSGFRSLAMHRRLDVENT